MIANIPIKLYYTSVGTLYTKGNKNNIPFIFKLSNIAYQLTLVTPYQPYDDTTNLGYSFQVRFLKGDGTTTTGYSLANIGAENVDGETWYEYSTTLANEVLSVSTYNRTNLLGISFYMTDGNTQTQTILNSEVYYAQCQFSITGTQSAILDTPLDILQRSIDVALSVRPTKAMVVLHTSSLPTIITDTTSSAYNVGWIYMLDADYTYSGTNYKKGDTFISQYASGISTWVLIGNSSSTITDIQNAITALQSQVATNTNAIATNALNIATNTSAIASVGNTSNEALGKANQNIEDITALQGDLEQTQNDITALQGNIGTINETIQSVQDDVEELQDNVGLNNANILALQSAKLDKIWVQVAQASGLANSDWFIINSGSTSYKVTVAQMGQVLGNLTNHYLGDFVNLNALETAHPTATAGDYAYVKTLVENDTILIMYIWDSIDNEWQKQDQDTGQYVLTTTFATFQASLLDGTFIVKCAENYKKLDNTQVNIETKFDSVDSDISDLDTRITSNEGDIAIIESTLINNLSKIIQLDFSAVIENGIIIASPTSTFSFTSDDNNKLYEIDILLPVVSITGSLNYTLPMYILDSNSNKIVINNVLNSNSEVDIKFGEMEQIVDYNVSTGFRWIFNATYNQVANGGTTTRVLNIAPTISKLDNVIISLDNDTMLNAITSGNTLYGYFKVGQIATPSDDDGFIKGHIYQYLRGGSVGAYIYDWNDITATYTLGQANATTLGGIKASEKTARQTQQVYIDTTSGLLYVLPQYVLTQATANALGGIIASAKNGSSEYTVEVKIDTTTGKLYVPVYPDLSGYVPTSRTIADINLASNITKSSLVNALGGFDNGSLTKGTIISTTITSGAKTISGTNNTEYRFTYSSGVSSLTFSSISTPTTEYCFSVIFISGSTATTITNTLGVYWLGQDVSSGVFTPIANKQYQLSIWYNGLSWYGSVIRLN